jgi:hypothetical protein
MRRVGVAVVAVGGVSIASMALVVAIYLFDIYGRSSLRVALPATLLVIVTAILPCWLWRRRYSREARNQKQVTSRL